ncbi:PREDICTED: uncharacterized protein LOC104718996 [Camelina sativa]|uniref:Uncharacterized protein LOC104718996 n=1 Tax=Camelina sativa TaxID=90675 RepID=A0ABM1QJE9_CAMSA|nr:PREDICTED: uncharacterized protein LOC104718996 [Camelina sativa]
MDHVIFVCGKWIYDEVKWLFVVDNKRGGRILDCNNQMSYDDCIQLVYKDYGLDEKVYDIWLSYKISKVLLQKLPSDTPPVFITNSRQFHGFLKQLKSDTLRLCVEVTAKVRSGSKKRARDDNVLVEGDTEFAVGDIIKEDSEVDDDKEIRFDNCDDSNGTDYDDENFNLYGIPPEEEEKPTAISPNKKTSSGIFIEEQKEDDNYAKLELSSLNLAVGQCYETKKHLETRLQILTIVEKFDYYKYKSNPRLLIVKCWVKGCKWRVRATTGKDYPKFHVRVFISQHTCLLTERSSRTKQANHEILGALYKDFVGGVWPKVLPMHVAEALNKRFQIKMEYWKAYRTLRHARQLVRGSPESGYMQLNTYLYMLKRANPGTYTQLELDDAGRFKYLFLAYGASLNGFPFMRKVLVVDGTFLQGKYKGTLLTATT